MEVFGSRGRKRVEVATIFVIHRMLAAGTATVLIVEN
jgi:hypothetical protein